MYLKIFIHQLLFFLFFMHSWCIFFMLLLKFILKMRITFNYQNYQFSIDEYQNKNVIFVHFTYNLILQKELKEKF